MEEMPREPLIDQHPKESGAIRKIFNASSWFVFFAFLPAAVLILLSQNTIPGDLFYPVKRGMENVVLAAATVSPATRVAFRTDLTERRFDEAEKLLLARADITGLSHFIEEVQAAQQEVSVLSNPESKQELTEKLVKKIDEYQNKLSLVQEKTQTNTSTLAPSAYQSKPTSIIQKFTPTSTQQIISPKPTSAQGSVIPSITPTSIVPTAEPSPTQVQIPPSPTPVPPVSDNKVEEAIDETKKELDEIKNKLKKGHGEKIEKEKKDKEEKTAEVKIKVDEDKREKNKGKK